MLRIPSLTAAGMAAWANLAAAQSPMPGRFVFEAPVPDGAIPGEIEVTGAAPSYSGWIRWIGGAGPDSARITSVTPAGPNVTVVGDNPQGRWTVHMAFAADTFSGTYEGPESGTIHGRRALVNPAGVYDFEALPAGGGGRKAAGRLVVKYAGGAYSGTAAPDGAPEPAQISSVTISGSDVNIRAELPSGGAVLLKLKAKSDSLIGTYEVLGPQAESGEFRAARIR